MLSQDIRYALRSFRRAPGFTFVALLTLALGIGGTTAIFSIVDGVLLRPLPYPAPGLIQRIVRVNARSTDGAFSAADFLDLKRDTRAFASMAGFREDIVDVTGRGEPLRVPGVQTTAGFFDVFQAPPIAGRLYREATDQPGAALAVISERLWRQQFGREPSAIGTKVRINGNPTEIVGVVAESFRHPVAADIWTLSPLEVPVSPIEVAEGLASRDLNYFMAIGRVADPASMAAADEQLHAVAARLAREFPDTNADRTFEIRPLAESLVADIRGALWILLGAVGFVLLIACANVAGLLMARGTSRRRELAVRTALGAHRGRLMQQLLTESLVLASAGGALGLLVGSWILSGLVALAPDNIPRLDEVTLDWRVALFTLAATLTVGVLFGLVPARQASRPELNSDLKEGGRAGTARTGARSVMVVAQVALALVLLIGAGLMLTSLSRLQSVDPGFRTTELVSVQLPLPQARYNESRQRQFYGATLERLRANPVTAESALLFPFPLGGSNARLAFEVEGQPERTQAEQTPSELNMVSDGYFRTAGMRLIAGRDFSAADGPDAPPVAIVNEAALGEFGGRNPIGTRINLGEWATVVGVVSDARRSSLGTPPQPAVFLPYTQ
ncbi:MAG: ABC transporter permease, partial [Vicinamibacterales bacterium]